MALRLEAPEYTGLMIVGTSARCGKTVLAAGLASVFSAHGLKTQAYKPLSFTHTPFVSQPLADQLFLDTVTQQRHLTETLMVEAPEVMTLPYWYKMKSLIETCQFPVMFDTPGDLTTPWLWPQQGVPKTLSDRRDNGTVNPKTACTLATELKLPILLVCSVDSEAYRLLETSLAYLHHQSIKPIGLIFVETTQTPLSQSNLRDLSWEGFWQATMMVSHRWDVPCLGVLPYSPSISVEAGKSGNLSKLIESEIDLLPLQMASGLMLSVPSGIV